MNVKQSLISDKIHRTCRNSAVMKLSFRLDSLGQ